MSSENISKYVGIFLISLATLLLELSLTRILSVGFFYHFGFMVISTAMLGFGIAGTILAIYKRKFESVSINKLVGWLSFGFGVMTILTYVIAQYIAFNPFQLFSDIRQFILFPIYYLILSIPFLFSGLIISLLFTFTPGKIYKLYAWDLVGAGLGCAVVALIMPVVGGVGSIFVSASIGFVSAALFGFALNRNQSIISLVFAIVVLILSPSIEDIVPIRITEGKGRYFDSLPIFSKWNTMSKIEVYEIGPISDKGIFSDSMRWIHYDGGTALSQILDYRPSIDKYVSDLQSRASINDTLSIHSSLAFLMGKENPKVLIIGSAGGKEVMHALFYNASQIDAIEINPLLNKLVGTDMADYAGHIYSHPIVNVHTVNARTFIKRTSEKYDIIISSHTLSNAAMASGALSLAEDYIYTTEAFIDYWKHLSDDGILFLTRNVTDFPRFTTTIKAVLKAQGIDEPENHLLIMDGAYYVSKRQMDTDDLRKAAYILQVPEEGVLYKPTNKLLFFHTHDSDYDIYHKILRSNDVESLYAEYPFKISPGTDNSPFINHKFKWSSLNYDLLKSTFQEQENVSVGSRLASSTPIAEFVLIIMLVQSVDIAGIMILLPLIKLKMQKVQSKTAKTFPAMLYFSGLGLGFILMEMALLQKYQLYLGQPIYTYAIILGSLLIFTGAGSFISNYFSGSDRKLLNRLLPIICLVFTICYFFIPVLFDITLSLHFSIRLAIAAFSVLPLGVLLGIPFPIGLKLLKDQSELIPWAWGVNSFFTVIGAILSIIIGMTFGFSWAMFIAGSCYMISWIAARFFSNFP